MNQVLVKCVLGSQTARIRALLGHTPALCPWHIGLQRLDFLSVKWESNGTSFTRSLWGLNPMTHTKYSQQSRHTESLGKASFVRIVCGCSFDGHCTKVGASTMPFSKWMAKQVVVHPHSGILCSCIDEQGIDSHTYIRIVILHTKIILPCEVCNILSKK